MPAFHGLKDSPPTIQQMIDKLWGVRSQLTTMLELMEREANRRGVDPDIHKYDAMLGRAFDMLMTYDALKDEAQQSWFQDKYIKWEQFKNRLGAIYFDAVQLKKLKVHDAEMYGELIKDLTKINSENYDAIHELERWKKMPAQVTDKTNVQPSTPDLPKKGWKDQLNDVAVDLLNKEEQNTPVKELIDLDNISNKVIMDLASKKIRLLRADEPFGFVTAPVICSKSYISKYAWAKLQQDPMQLRLEFVHQSYVLIKNAWLLGYSDRLIAELGLSIEDLPSIVHKRLVDLGTKDIKGMSMVGGIQSKGNHYYALLMPNDLVSRRDLTIGNWEFSKGVLPGETKNDIEQVTEDEIQKELQSLKSYIPEA